MLNYRNIASTALLCMGVMGLGHAHLGANSLLPQGGETIKVGDTFTITWEVKEAHKKGIDVALSKNNGVTWANIISNYQDTEVGSDIFKWKIPADAVTGQAKIRICQAGPCSDDQNTANASGNAPWRLVSGTFTIQAASASIVPIDAAVKDASLDFNPSTRNVEIAFALAESREVSLQAFDTEGRLVATFIQSRYAAGAYHQSAFSSVLASVSGNLVFKLKVGDETKIHTWLMLR